MITHQLSLICGNDIPIPSIGAEIHAPTIDEISFIGEETYFSGQQTLLIDKNMFPSDKIDLSALSNFQILMEILQDKQCSDKRLAVEQLLMLLFNKYQVSLMPPRSILLIQNSGDPIMIDESNFEELRVVLKEIFCVSDIKNQEATFNPGSEKAKAIAEKIMAGRKRVQELKGEDKSSIFVRYLSVLSVALKQSFDTVKKMNLFQLYDWMERFQMYNAWDVDMRARLAGADIKEKPIEWTKNIH